MPSPLRITLLVVLCLTLFAPATAKANTGGTFTSPCGRITTPQVYTKFLTIVMENHDRSQVVGGAMPNLSSMIAKCTEATNYHAIRRPSQPNYIAMTSGNVTKTDGTAFNNCVPTIGSSCRTTRASIFSQVGTTGAWTFNESMTSNCARVTSQGTAPNLYVAKHNPQLAYTNQDTACSSNNVPMGTSTGGNLLNAVNAGTLRRYNLVVPNQCNNGHDCGLANGNTWLGQWLPVILNGPDYQAGNLVVIITWDEGQEPPTDATLNPVAFVCISPSTKVAFKGGTLFNHYSYLKTVELELGLPALGNAGAANNLRTACNI